MTKENYAKCSLTHSDYHQVISKSTGRNKIQELYLRHCQTSMMEFFAKIVNRFQWVFSRKSSSQMFNRVLNTSLSTSTKPSNHTSLTSARGHAKPPLSVKKTRNHYKVSPKYPLLVLNTRSKPKTYAIRTELKKQDFKNFQEDLINN